jgi:hypothetical protein
MQMTDSIFIVNTKGGFNRNSNTPPRLKLYKNQVDLVEL